MWTVSLVFLGVSVTFTCLCVCSTRYSMSMYSELKLEHVIDKCGSVLEELNSSKTQVKYAQGDLLRDMVRHIRTNQKELTEAREQLQLQWRQALARVVQASQLKVHQKNANKVRVGGYTPPSSLLLLYWKPVIYIEAHRKKCLH